MAPKVDNPVTTHFEFMGLFGASFIPVALPLTVYALHLLCNEDKGNCDIWDLPQLPAWESFFSYEAMQVFVGWFAFQSFLYMVLPGEVHEGLPLRTGERLKYKCNGLAAFWVSLLCVCAAHLGGLINLAWIHGNLLQLMTASILFSFALSVYLYLKARQPGTLLAEGGNSGYAIYDFFIGHELNPRIGDFDLKFFCELRPGLIGWVVICLGMVAQQYEQNKEVDMALVLVTLFQSWYVLDAFLSEPALLSTMDICQDGFGFMLVFGDLVWVPFTYTLQARYLADFPQHHSSSYIALILLVQLVGYCIFRGANGQKDQFKRDPTHPSVRHLKTIPTTRGTKLIASGWWGMARHINYFGDLLMALAWSLPCGCGSIIPYFYPIYFAVLLWHRERRDEHKCAAKYGDAWKQYCAQVPYRIIPYVY